jgi:hypothetical protein
MKVEHENSGVSFWTPEMTISYPKGGACRPRYTGVVTAAVYRMKGHAQGLFKDVEDVQHPEAEPDWFGRVFGHLVGQIDPAAWKREMIWASVNHNERVNSGAAIQFERVLNTTGTGFTAQGDFTAIGIANTSIVAATGHLSIMTTTAFNQSREFTTIGLGSATTRITAGNTSAGYTAPSSLNAVATATVTQSYTATGAGTAYGMALFDSATVASGNLYVEVDFTEGQAVVATNDILAVTWTISM